MRNNIAVRVGLICGLVLVTTSAWGQGTEIWKDGAMGSWFDANNWFGQVPDSRDIVAIDRGTAQLMQPAGSVRGLRLARFSGSATLAISSAGDLSVTDFTTGIGEGGTGNLSISAGGKLTTNRTRLGEFEGALGTSTVDGSASMWTITEALIVGDSGAGTLNISNGGMVQNESDGYIGLRLGSDSQVTVSGANSKWMNAAGLFVGGFAQGSGGSGVLTIKEGGLVTVGSALKVWANGDIGQEGTGRLVVGGDPSMLPSEGGVYVLGRGTAAGTMDIVGGSGAVVSAGAARIDGPRGTGVTIAADGMWLPRGTLVVGKDAFGELNIMSRGVVGTVFTDASIGLAQGSHGEVTVDDRSLLLVNDLEVGLAGTGTLTITNSAKVHAARAVIGPNGKVTGHEGTLKANEVHNFGIIEPGNSPGMLTIEGNYIQGDTGKLALEIADSTAGQFDALKVLGNSTIGGELMLEFIDGFAPRQGDQFQFLDVSGTLNGQFGEVEIINLAPGFQFDVRRDGGNMTMVALNDGVFVPPPPVSTWNVDADGNWSSAGNWNVAVPNAPGAAAIFASKITAPRNVIADVPIAIGRIDFDSTRAYTIAGSSTVTLDANSGNAQINLISGNHTISAPLTLADNTLITVLPAAGSLSITGPVSAGTVMLTKEGAGTLTLNNLRAAGLSINAGAVAIAPHVAAPELSTSVLGTLSIAGDAAPTAKLDLNNNAAILNYTGTSPAATVRQQILAGRGGPGIGRDMDGSGNHQQHRGGSQCNRRRVALSRLC
jgi:T5SS/PEP-CTERM-associated repeat protein